VKKTIPASSTERSIFVGIGASQRDENKKNVEMVSLKYDTVKNIKINMHLQKYILGLSFPIKLQS
jgi:hypothetical protein